MTLLQSLILGILQGITEFLPISSSGHLVVFEEVLGLPVARLKSFDVAVHLGTLAAILVYFRKDFWGLIMGARSIVPLPQSNVRAADLPPLQDAHKYRKLWISLIIGTIPAVIIGLLFENQIDAIFRSPFSVALMMILVGVSFLLVEYFSKKAVSDVKNWQQALIIGLAQALALIPGVSRSGSTIAAGLAQGVNREKAARFSFLLGSVAIFGAAVLTGLKVWRVGELEVGVLELLVGFLSSALIGFFSVSFLMKFLKKHSLNVFGVYLVVVGMVILL